MFNHKTINVDNNPPLTGCVSSIITTCYDVRIQESTSSSHQAHDINQTSTTQPAYRGTTSQLHPPRTTHVFNLPASCYQPTPHIEQYDFRHIYNSYLQQ